MEKFAVAIEADIRKQSIIFGIALGVLCLPFGFVAGGLGSCCPLGSFVGVIPVGISGATAGFLAAMFIDWRRIAVQDSMMAGLRVGLRTSLIASSLGAITIFLVSLFGSTALWGSTTGSAAEGTAAAGAFATSNALVLLGSIVPGVVLGILGGIIGAAIKRPRADGP